ncbi:hypothetical protein MTO96_039886 [Rhipicephalus appendiculatus]
MAFAGIAPPDPFLPTRGRPVQPWSRWHDMFKVYLLASGASEFSPERNARLFYYIPWDPKVNVFSIPCLFRRRPKRQRRKNGPELRPTCMTPR